MKGNVLVIGNSGVGKSTLINAVLGENKAVTGYGTVGTTKELAIYESNEIPFRIIDTVGFEPTYLKTQSAIHAVSKWSKKSTKMGEEDTRINVIWFCVDGTSRKLFPKAIKDLARATSLWPSVPIIVVITKSYSLPEREQNIEMVREAFATHKRCNQNLKEIVPVVAQAYVINDDAYAEPFGITELIDETFSLLPEGIQASETDIANFKLNRKRALAHSVVGVATASAATVGAVPIPFPDAVILTPVEVAEVNALARIYGIGKDDAQKEFLNSIVSAGTVSAAAKAAINALKLIPGIRWGAAAINAVIAGSIVAALGEGAIYAFEQVYLGKKSVEDIDWVKKIMESKLSKQYVEKVAEVIESLKDTSGTKEVVEAILQAFTKK